MSVKGQCALCQRNNIKITKHHLFPKITHSKKKIKRISSDINETIDVCRPCHDNIHAVFVEKELAEKYNTIDALREHEIIMKFIDWIKDKPNELVVHNKRSNRRKFK
jgi:hypothetical protein